MASGNITRTPDYTLTSTEDITNAKINRVGGGTFRVDENSITNRELSVSVGGGFPNVASLRGNTTNTFEDGDAVAVRGFYTDGAGDFGPPLYYDASDTTTADDGISCFVDANGARFKRVFSGEINVKWAGAKGDAVTNDLPFLNIVINFIKNRTNAGGFYGGAIYVPIGDYVLKGELAFVYDGQVITNVRLLGEGGKTGEGGTRLIFQPDSASRGLVISSGWQFCFEDIEFICGNTNVTKLVHLEAEHSPVFSSYNMTFRHCAFRPYSGISPTEEMMRIQDTVQTEFYDCEFSGDSQKMVIGFEPDRTFDASADVNTTDDEITITGHIFEEDDPVTYTEGSGAIGGLTDATTYYVKIVDTNTIQLAASSGGAAIDLTSTGTGTATLTEQFEGGGGVGTLVFRNCLHYWNTEVINGVQTTYDNVVFGRTTPTTPVNIYPHATQFFRNNNVTFLNCSQVSSTASPVDVTFFEQGANSSGLLVLNSRFDGYRTTFHVNGKGNATFSGNIYNPPTGFTANTIEGIILGANADKIRIGTENFDGLTSIGAVPVDDNRSSPRWPLVVDEAIGSDFTFSSVGSYEDVLTASSVILEGGLYRVSWAVAIANAGSTPNFIVRPTVDGTAITGGCGYSEPIANETEMLSNSIITRINATETAVDIKLTVRQSTGTAATVRANGVTYPGFFQIEKI